MTGRGNVDWLCLLRGTVFTVRCFIKRDEVVKIQLRELQSQLPFRFLCQRDLCLPAQRTVISGQTNLVK